MPSMNAYLCCLLVAQFISIEVESFGLKVQRNVKARNECYDATRGFTPNIRETGRHKSNHNRVALIRSQKLQLQSKVKSIEYDNEQKYVQSNTSIYIGNLDWKIPSTIINENLYQILDGIENININLKEINTKKKRDIGKYHGGSAVITFQTEIHAQIGMNRLQKGFENQINQTTNYTNSITTITASNGEEDNNHKQNIQIRWAHGYKEYTQNNTSSIIKSSTPELTQHRQMRTEKYARQRRKIAKRTDETIQQVKDILYPSSTTFIDVLKVPKLPWETVPDGVHPVRGGGLKAGSIRAERKQAQVEAFVHVLNKAILNQDVTEDVTKDIGDESSTSTTLKTKKITVADLGSGAGNLSLPLAWFLKNYLHTSYQNVQVLAIDINPKALERLHQRAKNIGINIDVLEEDLLHLIYTGNEISNKSTYLESCSAVVSLHACGAASDLAIASAVSHSLPFAISPCCIGKVKSTRRKNRMPSLATERGATPEGVVSYPRSTALLKNEHIKTHNYDLLLSAADYSLGSKVTDKKSMSMEDQQLQRRGKMAKLLVETDRLKWAQDRGYYTRIMELPRLGYTYPKRELLLGARMGTPAARGISRLASDSNTPLFAKSPMDTEDNDDDGIVEMESNSIPSNNMDINGFLGYLTPYILTLFLSLIVTGAFIKFVLMDY